MAIPPPDDSPETHIFARGGSLRDVAAFVVASLDAAVSSHDRGPASERPTMPVAVGCRTGSTLPSMRRF